MNNLKNIYKSLFLFSAFVSLNSLAESAAPLLLNGELNSTAYDHPVQFDPVISGAKIVSKYGEIEKTYLLSPDNSQSNSSDLVIAWLINSGGQKKILFSNYQTSYLWVGDMWRSADGANVSTGITVDFMDKNGAPFNTVPTLSPTSSPASSPKFIMDGKWANDVPDVIKKLDSLPSFKEGNGGVGDTVFIFIDPKCPWCHKTYKNTRAIIQKGYTIKWIPTNLLGGDDLSSAIIDSNDQRVFNLIMSTPIPSLPSLTQKMPGINLEKKDKILAGIRDSSAFLMGIFQEHPEIDKQGVPAALMLDHTTGRPRLVMGISEQEVIDNVWGK